MTIIKSKVILLSIVLIVCLTLQLSSCGYAEKVSNIKSDPGKTPSVTGIEKLGLTGSISADLVCIHNQSEYNTFV